MGGGYYGLGASGGDQDGATAGSADLVDAGGGWRERVTEHRGRVRGHGRREARRGPRGAVAPAGGGKLAAGAEGHSVGQSGSLEVTPGLPSQSLEDVARQNAR